MHIAGPSLAGPHLVCNLEQRRRGAFCHTLGMHIDRLTAVLLGKWILAVGVLAYITDPASPAGWTVLAAVTATSAVIMMRLWRVPSHSVSKGIQGIVR